MRLLDVPRQQRVEDVLGVGSNSYSGSDRPSPGRLDALDDLERQQPHDRGLLRHHLT